MESINSIDNIEMNIMSFLRNKQAREMQYQRRNANVILIKSQYDADTEFLYSNYGFKGNKPRGIGDDLYYAGIYSFIRDKVIGTVDGVSQEFTAKLRDIIKEAEDDIVDRIIKLVDGKPVPVYPDSEDMHDNKDYYIEHGADEEALRCFYKDVKPEFMPKFKLDGYSTGDFIKIINHYDQAVLDYAEAYIREKARYINLLLWQVEVATDRLNRLNATPGNHHTIKKIDQCVDVDKMKSVTITIEKEGKRLDVKMETRAFVCGDRSYYSKYYMDAAGRREFEQLFGRAVDLVASDIQSISYGRKVIYRKDGSK